MCGSLHSVNERRGELKVDSFGVLKQHTVLQSAEEVRPLICILVATDFNFSHFSSYPH
jgi:hypothetical protein